MGFLDKMARLAESPGAQALMAMASDNQQGNFQKPDGNDRAAYASRAAQAVAGDVRMFSGCADSQTSADVHDVSSFGLPPNSGPGGAGGACTNSMVLALSQNPNQTWVQLLGNMRQVLRQKGYTQIPQLSSSREINLQSPFQVKTGGRTKALYIGINYVGQQGELRGCHNDVIMMKRYIESQGFDPNNCMVLMDDGRNQAPTHANIMKGFDWLVEGAQPGDSLFMHYSGHGGSVRDQDGDEADGMDETMIPVDYQRAGQIRDDEIFKELVTPVPHGVTMTVVMDCCHSGSILDLPYNFEATDANMQQAQNQAQNGQTPVTMPNGNFNWAKALKVAMELFKMHQKGATPAQMLAAGMKAFF